MTAPIETGPLSRDELRDRFLKAYVTLVGGFEDKSDPDLQALVENTMQAVDRYVAGLTETKPTSSQESEQLDNQRAASVSLTPTTAQRS